MCDPMSSFKKKDQMIKINKINKVYDGPLLRLVHHRDLKLKLTVQDLFGKQRKTRGTKT